MSADNTLDTSQTTDTKDQSKGNDGLAALQEQLKSMNEKLEATQQAILAAQKPQTQTQEREYNLYEPADALKAATDAAAKLIKEENRKNHMIYSLSQEYPEIQSKPEVRQAVLEAQRTLPTSMQDTAEGYEMAVLKAVAKSGLLAKSKRQTVDDDVSFGSGSGSRREETKTKVKVSKETLAFAELMGRDIKDPKVLASLEQAANRNFGKYE